MARVTTRASEPDARAGQRPRRLCHLQTLPTTPLLLATLQRLAEGLQAERERNALLERLRKNVVTMVDSLARALEDRDPYTAGHSLRVAEYSLLIGRELGLSDLELEVLRHGAALHDIGKIAVRQDVLHKPQQ